MVTNKRMYTGVTSRLSVTILLAWLVAPRAIADEAGTNFCGSESFAASTATSAVTTAAPTEWCEIPDDASMVSVMVAYTSVARMEKGGTAAIEALIAQAVDDMNTALADSKISTQLQLVHTLEVDYVQSDCLATDLARLGDPTDGFLDEVPVARDDVRADLVSLWVPRCTLVSQGDTCDICGIAAFPSTANAGYNVLGASQVSAASTFLYAHETGHNFGGTHGRAATPPDFPWSTIMATPITLELLPQYSNPDVRVKGQLTGDALHDNAGPMNAGLTTVANFRNTPDCNCNGIDDSDDIATGTSVDADGDGIPDECQCSSDGECDDGVFCNGLETCDLQARRCLSGQAPCALGEVCNEVTDTCDPTFTCGNMVCELGEDCTTCPDDCFSASSASCGNNICEVNDGEDCSNCPSDCNGGGSGSNAFCCGAGKAGRCQDERCNLLGFFCTTATSESCCGDGNCTGTEDNTNCAVDCP